MEQHTKIIDLYGLPGCGKTTLMTFLKDSNNASISFGYLPDITVKMKRHSLRAFFKAFSFRQFFLLTRLFLSLPILPLRNWNIYAGFYELSWIYNYARFCNDKDFVLVDHGIVQSLGSLTYGHVESFSKKNQKILEQLLDCLSVEKYCYCKICVDKAVERIRKRNRQSGRGRLDLIKNDDDLSKALVKQERIFSSVSEMITFRTLNKSIVLNMESGVEDLGFGIVNIL